MRLLFKQRFFSWLDSYDIYDESGNIAYVVKGQLSWGHCLKVYDAMGQEAGLLQERIFTWLPKFEIYTGGQYRGCIRKEFSLFTPRYVFDCCGWQVEGNFMEWDYTIRSGNRQQGTVQLDGYLCAGYSRSGGYAAGAAVRAGDRCRKMLQKQSLIL